MARKLRVEYAGAIYHVMNRGDRREEIFKDDADRGRFLEALGEVCVKTGWQVQAWCLMGNHFHLLVETPQGNLVAGMKWLLGTYTSRFNRRHKLFGHLFSGRYKALIVDGSGNGYLKAVCDYVHLNPARGGLVTAEAALSSYRWSSWPEYLKRPSQRGRGCRWIVCWGISDCPGQCGGAAGVGAGVGCAAAVGAGADYQAIRRGWCLGEETFRKELLAQMTERRGAEHYGAERLEMDVAKAERILREELKRRRWQEADLAKRAKGDLGKVQIAGRLREETLVTVKWIAARLEMGTAGYVNNRLYRWRKGTLA